MVNNNFQAAQQPQQAAQQQQMQNFPHQGLNGGWQSDKDYQERRKMIGKIVLLLQQRKPNAPPEWLKKLPQMAKRLEESLYRSAKSFDEYNDASTLKQRLQQLAVNIGMKTKKLQQAQIMQHQKQLQQQVQQQQQQRQPNQQAAVARQAQPNMNLQVAAQQQQQKQQQQILPAQPQAAAAPAAAPQRMVNMSEINPMIAAPAPAAPPVQQVQYTTQQQQQPTAPAPAPAVPAPAASTAANGGRQVSDRQQVLRHQQQRLLLLRHAAKCQHEDGRCPVTPHCAGMKRLWKHIAECKNQKCLVPHCVSSRYVLSHYHRCKDVRCPVCGPVREAIHRSHEKQKHMQALKQRHQQAVQQNNAAAGGQASAAVTAAVAVAPTAGVPSSISASMEPPNKRRKSGALAAAPAFQQARPLAQPGSSPTGRVPGPAGIPVQQSRPGIAAQGGILAQAQRSGIPGKAPVVTAPGLAFSNGQVIMPKTVGPKPQEDHTLINCFSVEQIEKHIESLHNGLVLSPLRLKTKCMEVLRILQSHQHAWVFNTPVDPVELGLPDYFEVIKHPMDLGTVRKKLENGVYTKITEFEAQCLLTFDNAMLYNPEGSVVYNMAKDMKTKFQQDFAKLMAQLNAEEDIKRRNGEACLLCGCEKLLFEPPVFYCNGMNCPSKRIRRNSYYYVAGNNQYHWCHLCYQEIRDNTTLDLGDVSMKKEALVKKKNDEVHEESWVQCDRCERWVHQICALFNTRQNKDQRSEYACPRCTIEERKKRGNMEASSSTPMAEDLPRTVLSEYLENHVRVKMNEFIEKKSFEKSTNEGIPIEEARKKLQMGGAITIRQVTSMDRKLEVRERMKKRYAFKNYPDEFTYRCKCIVVFQNLDGVDVMLFGLYVYEHDEKNPSPNNRVVYVSYLDSVYFMRPRQMRTFIYHEILISYLDYVRRRGFVSAHIWACPPLKGDDYILYAKPEDQKVPKDDRLRQWYIEMLVECQRRGVVGKVTNMYDLYFSDPKLDATAVPYLEGDYFPAEAENIIKDIEDGKAGKGKKGKQGTKGKNKDKKAKQKKKAGGRGGTRSAGLDEDALKASGLLPPGTDSKSLEEGARDYVMVKLGETIQPMKESFIVAFLSSENAKEEHMEVPKAIQEYREKHGITWKIGKRAETDAKTEAAAEEKADGKPADTVDSGAEKTADEKPVIKIEAGVETEKNDPMDIDRDAAPNATDAAPEADKVKEEASKAASQDDKMDVDDEKKEGEAAKPGEANPQPSSTSAACETTSDAKAATSDPDFKSADRAAGTENPDGSGSSGASEEKKDSEPSVPVSDEASNPPAAVQTSELPTPLAANTDEAAKPDAKETEKPVSGETTKPDTASPDAPNNDAAKSDTATVAEEPKPTDTAAQSTDAAAKDEIAKPDATESDEAGKPDAASAGPNADKAEAPKSDEAAMPEAAKLDDAPKPDTAQSDDAPKPVAAQSDEAPKPVATQSDDAPKQAVNTTVREGKFAAMAARKRDVEGEPKKPENEEESEKEKKAEPKTITVTDSKGQTVKVLDDDEEELDCEFLNNRQAFLNLCQGNHYQFDQIRRAKHSSVMVLWHLHNRDAPKFVQQCATCSREILQGYRYHCPTCADFDQCADCVQNPKIPRHPHPLKPIPIASGQQNELTAAQRKERQRSIQLHMTLLQHAATCDSAKCPSANCTKMKGLLKHGAQCQVKAVGGCNVCKRIWALLQIHARQCRKTPCPVPNCMAIRERVRQLKKQQQAMDDRRRQEMNRAYRGKR